MNNPSLAAQQNKDKDNSSPSRTTQPNPPQTSAGVEPALRSPDHARHCMSPMQQGSPERLAEHTRPPSRGAGHVVHHVSDTTWSRSQYKSCASPTTSFGCFPSRVCPPPSPPFPNPHWSSNRGHAERRGRSRLPPAALLGATCPITRKAPDAPEQVARKLATPLLVPLLVRRLMRPPPSPTEEQHQ